MSIVSLTTDYGHKDFYTAQLKAAILQRIPDATIVDINHNIKHYDIVEGAFFIENAYRHFPKGTIHLGAIQVYHSTNDDVIAFEHEGHYFVGPNNGLFSLVFDQGTQLNIYTIKKDDTMNFVMDVFGHAIAAISHGLGLEDIGTVTENVVQKIGIQPVKTGSQIRATIIHIDQYGNVIVNLKRSTFEQLRQKRRFKIYYKSKDPITVLSKHYGNVQMGEVLAYFNASGYLEIAVNMGNANELLSLRKHETIQIDFFD